MTEYIFIATGW